MSSDIIVVNITEQCKSFESIFDFLVLSIRELVIRLETDFFHFGPRVYPMGSMVIALVSLLVRPLVRPSIFQYLRNRSLVFSETVHEVRGQ